MRRRDALRAGLTALLSSCSDARPHRTLDSGRAPWSPASLAPQSADPSKPLPIALVLGTRARDELRRGFALAQPEFSSHEMGASAAEMEDTLRGAAKGGARLLVVGGGADLQIVSRVARERRVPVLLLDATDGQVTGAGEWLFFTCASDEKLGAAAVQIAKKRGASRIAVICADSVAGRAAAAGFRTGLDVAGLPKPILEVRVGMDEAPFAKHVKSTEVLRSDAVFAPMADRMLETLAAEIARQGARSEHVIGVDTMMSDAIAKGFEGASFVAHYHAEAPGPANETFVGSMKARHLEPGVFEAIGHDAATIARSAMARTKDELRESLRDALAATQRLPLTTGEATFDKRGCPDRTVVLCRFSGGRILMDGTALAKS